jgi:hypothetical protein
MSIKTTSNNDTLISLGLNPGLVENYSNVSLEPVRFRKLGSLGWGHTYEAIHSCSLGGADGKEGEVGGLEFSVAKGKGVRDTWKLEQEYSDDSYE